VVMAKNIETTSWKDNRYELFFYGLVRGLRPRICVELGTYHGYSAYHMGKALHDNGKGSLVCYDLWEEYPYRHVGIEDAREVLSGLPITLLAKNAMSAINDFHDGTVDLLMVDLSNDGDIYGGILRNWHKKLADNAIVLMEGGIIARDKIEWMLKYKKTPIVEKLRNDEFIRDHYTFNTIEYFPGLTIFNKL
jgi:predicted O-methyltransferase YrrM